MKFQSKDNILQSRKLQMSSATRLPLGSGLNVLSKLTTMSHYSDVIMGAMASQITSLTIVCSTVYSGADQRKYQGSASLAFVRGIHRWPVNSPHKWPVTRKMFPFDHVIMNWSEPSTNTLGWFPKPFLFRELSSFIYKKRCHCPFYTSHPK